MKKKVYLIVFALALLLSFTANAQERIIKGTISSNGDPVVGVKITVKNTEITTTSDKKETYIIKLPEGKITLVFNSSEFMEQEVTVGENNIVDVDMKRITKSDLVKMYIVNISRK